MIELERHIEILLLSNDCVIVPRLGGFMTHHIEAYYDEQDHLFLPPLRTLGFNSQLNINDSLLVQSYIEAYDISYPEALQRIEGEVNELRQHLENEGSYELNDIGVLTLNDDGNLVFTPCEAGILTPELYGLSSFEMNRLQPAAIQTVPVAETQEQRPATEQLPAAQVVEIDGRTPAGEPEEETPVEDDDDDSFVRIRYSWIRNAVAVAAVLLAVFILALPSGKTDMMQRTISNINNGLLFGMMSEDTNTSKITISRNTKENISRSEENISRSEECGVRSENTLKADSITKSVAGNTAKSQADNTARSVADSASTTNPTPHSTLHTPQKAYCIVLATQVSKHNADAFIERLQKQGFDQAQIFVRKNITRVIYGHYASEEDARDDLRRFHRNSETAEAWLMQL